MSAVDEFFSSSGATVHGDGHRSHLSVYTQKVSASGVPLVALNTSIPPNREIVAVVMKFATNIVLTGGTAPVKIGVGVTGDPDSIILSGTTMTAGTVTAGLPLVTKFVTTSTPLAVTACNTSGSADGNWSGTILIQIHYQTFDTPA